MITGASLRTARETAGFTQQATADMVGVTIRTLGTWERSGDVIPKKYWDAIYSALPDARVYVSLTESEFEEKARALIREAVGKVQQPWWDANVQHLDFEEFMQRHVDMVNNAYAALDLAESALGFGVDADLISDFVDGVVSMLVDADTVAVLAQLDQMDVFGTILNRARDIARRASIPADVSAVGDAQVLPASPAEGVKEQPQESDASPAAKSGVKRGDQPEGVQ